MLYMFIQNPVFKKHWRYCYLTGKFTHHTKLECDHRGNHSRKGFKVTIDNLFMNSETPDDVSWRKYILMYFWSSTPKIDLLLI
jgi:hypothetical protein